MFGNAIERLVGEDTGMEMVEWSLVGVIFAIASALLWGILKAQVNSAVDQIAQCVGNSALCP